MRTIPAATDAAIPAQSRSTLQEDNSDRIGNQQHRTAFVRRTRWHGLWQHACDNITCLDLCEQTWGADTETGGPSNPATLMARVYHRSRHEHDAQKLTNLGYVVFSVVSPPVPRGWLQRLLGGVLGSAQPRLTVSYRDQGVVR